MSANYLTSLCTRYHAYIPFSYDLILSWRSVVERFVPQNIYTRWHFANYSNEMELCSSLLDVPVLLYHACFVIISYALIWMISKCDKWEEASCTSFQFVSSSSRPRIPTSIFGFNRTCPVFTHLPYITISARSGFSQCERHERDSFERHFDRLNDTAAKVNFTWRNRTFSTYRTIGTSPLLHNGIFFGNQCIFTRRLLTNANFCRSLSREWKQNSLILRCCTHYWNNEI